MESYLIESDPDLVETNLADENELRISYRSDAFTSKQQTLITCCRDDDGFAIAIVAQKLLLTDVAQFWANFTSANGISKVKCGGALAPTS